MKKVKFSIIIPVYNVEKYVKKCIDSILEQTYKNYEIILVNDGSIDNSGKICDEYAKKYKNIKVIHQKNGGLSSARNTGIRNSSGEYLLFIDSDDFLNSKKNLYSLSKHTQTDIIQYRMIYYYDNIEKYISLKENKYIKSFNINDVIFDKIKDGTFSISACDKAIKRDLIVNNNLYFEVGKLSEDIDWSLRIYIHAKSITIINDEIYVYRQQRKDSITSKCNDKSIKSLFSIIEYWYNYNYDNNILKDIYYNYLAYQFVILLTIMDTKNSDKQTKKEILKLKDLLNYSENYKVKLANKIYRIFGLTLGTKILKIYLKLKNKGVLKI